MDLSIADTVESSYLSNGTYYPSMIVSNSTGCQNQIFLDTITVTDNTVYIDDIGDFSVCPNDSIEVNIVTNGNSSLDASVGVRSK